MGYSRCRPKTKMVIDALKGRLYLDSIWFPTLIRAPSSRLGYFSLTRSIAFNLVCHRAFPISLLINVVAVLSHESGKKLEINNMLRWKMGQVKREKKRPRNELIIIFGMCSRRHCLGRESNKILHLICKCLRLTSGPIDDVLALNGRLWPGARYQPLVIEMGWRFDGFFYYAYYYSVLCVCYAVMTE